jgi:hypothetical protein
MANPFPFVAGNVLTAAELNGIGEATAFTPTFNNLTIGNGTVTGTYMQVNGVVWGTVRLVFGSTTSVTGTIQPALPVTASFVALQNIGQGIVTDTGTANYLIFPIQISATNVAINAEVSSGTYGALTSAGAAVPFIWTTSDVLSFDFIYRAA